jgi:hypothetical protein
VLQLGRYAAGLEFAMRAHHLNPLDKKLSEHVTQLRAKINKGALSLFFTKLQIQGGLLMCGEHPWDFSSSVVLLNLRCLHDKCATGSVLYWHPSSRGNRGETEQGK